MSLDTDDLTIIIQKMLHYPPPCYFKKPLPLLLLQIRCFDAPLQPQALQDVKNIVERNVPSGVTPGGLTMDGQFQDSS